MKAKRIFSFVALSGVFLLTGCSVAIINTTPKEMPRSASGVYELSARIALTDALIDRNSIATFIIIDGETYPMNPHPYGGGFYQYQYRLPAERSKAFYYFELQYQYLKDNTPDVIKKAHTELSALTIVDSDLTPSPLYASLIRVAPAKIELQSGQRQAILFELSESAPSGGIAIQVTTDVPQSIIMPEVFMPAGMRTTSVTLQGDRPGSGKLYINAPGLEETKVPLRVRP